MRRANARYVVLAITGELRRAAIGAALGGRGFSIVGTGKNLRRALGATHKVGPDLLLFERRSTEETDLHALREFKRTKPDTGAIMLAERVFERELRRLFEAGVDAVIDRRSSLQSLANYADLVLSGERAVQPFLLKPAETEPQSLISQEVSAPMQQLSRREQAVAGLLAIGLTDKEIARQLDLVHGTVRNYVRSVQQKLSLANRTQIAVWALQHGIVDSAASRRTVN